MADDLGYNSIWSMEQNFSFSSSRYKIEGDYFLGKEKPSFNIYPEETVQQEESPQLILDDVLMLDDIREFSMKHDLSIGTETNFYGDDRIADKQKSPTIPIKTSFPSSQFEITPLKSPDEYLPSSPSEMSRSDTFQDLSVFMPQSSGTATTSSSLSVNSYFSSDSSSSSQFSNLHYEDKTLSVIEASTSTGISSIESSDGKVTKCTELKIMKQTRHKDIRKKNNLASQRSRMTRKEREREMENKEKSLEQENQMLRIKVAKLEELTGALKNQLFKSVLGK